MCPWYDIYQWFSLKDSDNCWQRKLTLKVGISQFLITFTQLTARLKNLSWAGCWFFLKEGLVECATACIKSEVIISTKIMKFPLAVTKYKLHYTKANSMLKEVKMYYHNLWNRLHCCFPCSNGSLLHTPYAQNRPKTVHLCHWLMPLIFPAILL